MAFHYSQGKIHIDFISQGKEADTAWSIFIPDVSLAGVERINDSICTYMWAILGSQAQTRSNIPGIGTAFNSKKQFLTNIEDAINSPVDLGAAIDNIKMSCSTQEEISFLA